MAVKVTLVTLHVSGPLLDADATGVVMFWVTVVDAEVMHPFDDVTVTVYVPGIVTTFVDEVPPPDHR